MKTKITFKGQPLSTQTIYRSACRGKFPTRYMTAKGKAMKEYYQWEAKTQYKREITKKPVEMEVNIFFKDKRRRDLDNHLKLIWDSLQGIVYEDDSQIQKLIVTKEICTEDPRVEVIIKEL